MHRWLDEGPGTPDGGLPRTAGRLLAACMLLLAAAAAWLVLTRPVHRIEGDFLEREDRGIADEWLEGQLVHTVAETRARAHLALSRIRGREALPQLVLAMSDPAPSVRAQAAFAAGNVLDERIGGPPPPADAAAALIAMLRDDDRVAATRAASALGKAGWREAASDITRSAAPIAVTMTALMRLQASGQASFVAEYLDSDDQDSRWAAALAARHLRLVRQPAVWERLAPLLTDDNAFVRAAALRAAGDGKPDAAAANVVRTGLEHPDPKVRFEAAAALAALQGSPLAETVPAGEPDLGSPPAAAPATPLLASGDYQAVARTIGRRLRLRTSQGDFEIELDYGLAPLTSEHFRQRAADGALDGAAFVAVRPNAYAVVEAPLLPARSELNPKPFLRGSLGLLRSGDASGGGFFVCLTALPLADGRYVNFGRLASGDARLDGLEQGATVLSVREVP